MKKLLLLTLAASLFLPGISHAEKKFEPNSFQALSCMKARECKGGVIAITSYDQIPKLFPDVFWAEHREEITELLELFIDLEVEVYVAPGELFPKQYRGVYFAETNAFFLNRSHVNHSEVFMDVMRHEGWHVAQDCMGGSLADSELGIIFAPSEVPEKWKEEAILRYGHDAYTVKREREALWAGSVPNMTRDALRICASGHS